MKATSRATSPAPTVEALDEAVENATLSEIMLCATASIDMIIGNWNDVSSFDAAVETDTYKVVGAIASMTFGLTFHLTEGMPILMTVVVSAGTLDDSVVILCVDRVKPLPEPVVDATVLARPLVGAQTTGLPDWPTPLATVLARALHQVMQIAAAPELTGPEDPLTTIHEIVRQATVFDPLRMRLRIDDQHGNRSTMQMIDGQWKAFASDGREVRFSYCLGSHGPEDEISRDLSDAVTVHDLQRAAMRHVRGLQDVQVEAIWERHNWNGKRFDR